MPPPRHRRPELPRVLPRALPPSPSCAAPPSPRQPAAAALGPPPASCIAASACSQVAKPPRTTSRQVERSPGCSWTRWCSCCPSSSPSALLRPDSRLPTGPPLLTVCRKRGGTSHSNKGKGRGLSVEIVTQLNSSAGCGLILERLRDLDVIVFSFIAIS